MKKDKNFYGDLDISIKFIQQGIDYFAHKYPLNQWDSTLEPQLMVLANNFDLITQHLAKIKQIYHNKNDHEQPENNVS